MTPGTIRTVYRPETVYRWGMVYDVKRVPVTQQWVKVGREWGWRDVRVGHE